MTRPVAIARALALLLIACLEAPFAALPAQAGPALPDTGLFAPVAQQYEARVAAIHDASRSAATLSPGQYLLRLATGRADDAAALLSRLSGDAREADVARARVMLARQDYAAAKPVLARLLGGACDRDDERSVRFAWALACDDPRTVDSLARGAFTSRDDAAHVPELLAAGRLANDMLDYDRADSCFHRALAVSPAPVSPPAWGSDAQARRSLALTGVAIIQQKHRQYDASLTTLREALGLHAGADVLMALTETLIRMGRTDEAISAAEWAVKLSPYSESAHYLLGNGYARKNYTQLAAAYPQAFADKRGRAALTRADSLLAAGRRSAARAGYMATIAAHPAWVDARMRLASLDYEDERYGECAKACFVALGTCAEYGRAHAILAKALEAQRFAIDVHSADYEARFAATPMPVVPGIEKFVINWKSLSPRIQKRVALSVAPWKSYVPVLIAGGSTFYIKPLFMLLSDCPAQRALRDTRIEYDSRLWDDVRGCGGYGTVTGIEDVARTVRDKYNTVLHELSHQVHAILPADDVRAIQALYAAAKTRDDATKNGYLSRYAGGSVFEFLAEGANSLLSPMRDKYDSREIVRERLDRIDPVLRDTVRALMARTDVKACYPVAYTGGGDDHISRGQVSGALPMYRKALEYDPTNETALVSYTHALVLAGQADAAEKVAATAVKTHPASGSVQTAAAEAAWCAGRGAGAAIAMLTAARPHVLADDRHLIDAAIGGYDQIVGDAPGALAAYDSVLAYQSDSPDGLAGRASALALSGDGGAAFEQYEKAVRMRTGIVGLRCDYARDLLRAGKLADARAQLEAAQLLDEKNAEAEALRAYADLKSGDVAAARTHAEQALAWGAHCDLAQIVALAAAAKTGRVDRTRKAWAPFFAKDAPGCRPGYVFRPDLSVWEPTRVWSSADRAIAIELGLE
jgi:tetratricopeptide (TPR) repeat protein